MRFVKAGFLLIFLCAHAPKCQSQIKINELQIAPIESGYEFVEIILVGSDPIDISQITLEDSRAKPGQINLPDGESGELHPGELFVLAQNPELLRNAFGPIRVAELKPWPALNNGGDKITVRSGLVKQDSLAYGPDDYSRGISLERIDPNVPARFIDNWRPSTAADGATPGHRNSVFQPDTVAVSILLAEYSSFQTIDIYFSEPIDIVRLLPGGIRLDNTVYEGILSELSPGVMRLDTGPDIRVIQFSTLSDFAGNISASLSRYVAQRVSAGDLVISEIMFDPDRDTHGDLESEWVEFVNVRSFPVSLTDLSLNVGPLNARSAKQYDLMRPFREIESGQYVLVYSEPLSINSDDASSSIQNDSMSEYLEAFNNATEIKVRSPLIIPVKGETLSLNNSGDVVSLVADGSVILDFVKYKAGWHDDRLSGTRGRSLSRIRLEASSMDPLNWVSSKSGPGYAGFTPGASRITDGLFTSQFPASGTLTFNEIMYEPRVEEDDGLPDQSEYLEIRNTSAWEIDLNGVYLTSGTVDGLSSDSLRLIYRPERLGPGELALIFHLPDHISDRESDSRRFLDAAFPSMLDKNDLTLVPIRSALSLSNGGEILALFAGNGEKQDNLSYDISWHHPLVNDVTGLSLEKMDAALPSSLKNNWSTSASPEGGTPGTRNTIDKISNSSGNESGLEISPLTITPDRDGVDDQAQIHVRGGSSNSILRVDIFDLTGRRVRSLVPATLYTGDYITFWNGLGDGARILPVGIYITLVRINDNELNTNITLKKPIGIFRD